MTKKNYKNKTEVNKVKEIPICGDCLLDSNDTGYKKWEYFWVDRGDHYTLSCKDCVIIENYKIVKPYNKKPGRQKKMI